MSYVVTNTRGQIIAVIPDGAINTGNTSQTLVGKNVTPYGEYEVENIVHQLENFANSTPPGNPIEGQLWWDTAGTLNVYSGTGWSPVKGLTVATSAPLLGLINGDLWFNPNTSQVQVYTGTAWVPINLVTVATSAPTGTLVTGQMYFNSATSQFFIYNSSTGWQLVGPEGVAGFAETRWTSTTLNDSGNVAHAVILGEVNGTTVSIVSSDNFTINATQRPTGFTSLVAGINMASGSILGGRATSADQLTTARTINGVAFNGTSNIIISNTGNLIPGNYISGNVYVGNVNQTWNIDATSGNTVNKIVARDASGNFSAGTITANLVGNVTGTATNVSGVVTAPNGGTGYSSYGVGNVLVGNGASLNQGQIVGSGPIEVTSTANGITVSYAGGTGTGNVTYVNLTPGIGIGVSGGPITSAGNIVVTNTGVTRLNPGAGITVSAAAGNITVINNGVLGLSTAGVGIGLSGSSGNIVVTNTGVTKLIAGTNISLDPPNGVGNVTINATSSSGGGYTLPAATTSVLGGVKVGGGLSVAAGVVSANVTQIVAGPGVTLSPSTGVGAVMITANPGTYTLPTATGSVLGGVKVGSGLTINNGVLSATGGSGTGTVYSVTAGSGLTGGTITTAGSIAVDSTVLRTTGTQTVTGLKQYTGGINSQAYNFTPAGTSIFYQGPGVNDYPEPVVMIPVNITTPYHYAHQFYNKRLVVDGSGDPVSGSPKAQGAAIIGIDNGVTGGAGVYGWHTGNQPGLGIGTAALTTNMTFTGAVFQGSSARPPSGDFVQFRSYSQNDVVFEVKGNGNVFYAGSVTAPGADYAEYFEWADGNPNSEDRVGVTVALDGNRVRPAVLGDTVLGVVSGNPSIVGDGAELAWAGQYLRDDWGRVITEEYQAYNWTDDVGKRHSVASFEDTTNVPATAEMVTVDGLGNKLVRPVVNPAYDPEVKYVPRSKRPEWSPVGLMGKLRVRKGQVMGTGWIKLRDISDIVEEWLVK
jgi:hypothetical protein